MMRQLTPAQIAEYQQLYARYQQVSGAYYQALLAGVQSATLSTAGNSQSYTRMSLAELRQEMNALMCRIRQLLGWPENRILATFPTFGP